MAACRHCVALHGYEEGSAAESLVLRRREGCELSVLELQPQPMTTGEGPAQPRLPTITLPRPLQQHTLLSTTLNALIGSATSNATLNFLNITYTAELGLVAVYNGLAIYSPRELLNS